MRRIGLFFACLFLLSAVASASPFSDQVKAVSWQLFLREWGRLTAMCSAGAYWTDGKVTRLLTASHCITLTQLEEGKAVEFLVTQTGADFQKARVLATGWRIKDPGGTASGYSVTDLLRKLPSAETFKPLYLDSRLDLSRGDWAILEIDGQKKTAPLGDSKKLSEQDAVFMFGYPLGGDRFFSQGYIANVDYQAPQTEWPTGYIAADVTAAPGNSGSLIVDQDGKAVAILVAGAGDRLHILTPLALVQKAIPCLAEPVCAYFQKP